MTKELIMAHIARANSIHLLLFACGSFIHISSVNSFIIHLQLTFWASSRLLQSMITQHTQRKREREKCLSPRTIMYTWPARNGLLNFFPFGPVAFISLLNFFLPPFLLLTLSLPVLSTVRKSSILGSVYKFRYFKP